VRRHDDLLHVDQRADAGTCQDRLDIRLLRPPAAGDDMEEK